MQRTAFLSYTAADLVKARRLTLRRDYRSRRVVGIIAIGWSVYLSVMLLQANHWRLGAWRIGALQNTALVTLAFLATFTLAWVLIQEIAGTFQSRRIFAQQRSMHETMEASWDEEGLSIAAASGTWNHPWVNFIKWAENDAVLVLYEADQIMIMLPKRLVDAPAINDIVDLLKRYGIPTA